MGAVRGELIGEIGSANAAFAGAREAIEESVEAHALAEEVGMLWLLALALALVLVLVLDLLSWFLGRHVCFLATLLCFLLLLVSPVVALKCFVICHGLQSTKRRPLNPGADRCNLPERSAVIPLSGCYCYTLTTITL